MRYSKQRELVMQTVQALCDHPTAEEIYDAAVKECPGLSLGTVYRNLNSLVDAGRQRDRRRGGRRTGDEAGQEPEGLRAGLRCGAHWRVRSLL